MAMNQSDREKVIIRTSIIGIAVNVALAIFKAAVGILSNSIAVILDAVNNLSDALSSVITIAGTFLAGKKPDRKHPFGHGRIEYLSALIVSAIVLYAGLTSLIESVKKIIHPETPSYTMVSLMIIAVAVLAKIILGRFVKSEGVRVGSGALEASGSDALFDALLSFSVLVSAVIFMTTGVSLEAFVGVVISIVIIKAGVEMMQETLSDILGRRTDPEVSREIKQILSSDPQVRGAYDLIINNYGPQKNIASVHLELPDTMTVEEVDILTRKLEAEVYEKTGVILTGVGVYSFNTGNNEAGRLRNGVAKIVHAHDWVLQMHGFFADTEKKEMRFDVVLSFDINPEEALGILNKEVGEAFPDYQIQITPDVDITD